MDIGEEWDDQGPNKNTTFQERLDEAKGSISKDGEESFIIDSKGVTIGGSGVTTGGGSGVTTGGGSGVTTGGENVNPSMTSGVDMQTIALPSIPSISNVGSVPFTGAVSNIPGGFQPLPQTAGGRKKLYQLSQFHGGLNQKSSPRDISDIECQEAENITFSSIGSIKLLGDIKGTDNSITVTEDDALSGSDMGAAGYGLFQFTAPADHDGANQGQFVLTLTADGNEIDVHDPTDGAQGTWMTIGATDSNAVAQIYYASGNGMYATDANFDTDNVRRAKIWVYREDAGSSQTVSGWKEGKPLIDSPTFGTSANQVSLNTGSHPDYSSSAVTGNGRLIFTCDETATTGAWDGVYTFYVSYIFDGGVETGLTSIGPSGNIDNKSLDFNVVLGLSYSNTNPIANNKRIEGARIYFKSASGSERFLLAEVSTINGVKGVLDSTFTPWHDAGSNDTEYDLESNMVFDNPPEIYTYASLNGYYANEVYAASPDATGTSPTALDLRYKSAVIGSGGIAYIGNVKFNGKHMPDSMMFSMQGKPGVFPQYNRFDSPSSDGSPITALASYRDKILQFKQNGMYAINVSNPNQFYAEASFRDCGVYNPCQVFTTSFGVIFANKFGCYIYDGQRVMSLTSGKFDREDWGLDEGTSHGSGSNASAVPCVGYDPRSQSIIVLKNIGNDSDDTFAWVYNMQTQSWTEGSSMITNANGNRNSNFIITSGGYLTIKQEDTETLYNYKQSNNSQTVTYITKDIDFGFPSQTKKIFKVYITYKGDANALTGTYGVNGDTSPTEAMTNSETSDATLENAGTTDHNIATFTLNSHPVDVKSIMFKFIGACGTDFEINDISILYRLRPIK